MTGRSEETPAVRDERADDRETSCEMTDCVLWKPSGVPPEQPDRDAPDGYSPARPIMVTDAAPPAP